jgi:hypothetical protein
LTVLEQKYTCAEHGENHLTTGTEDHPKPVHTHTHTHTHTRMYVYIHTHHISAQEKSDKTAALTTTSGGEGGGSPSRVILSLAPSTAPLSRNVTLNIIGGGDL